ncbi:MATE family efflux transporter [Tissierella sp. MB52-C2]|uniref:MATE family efflux transporter n=1 Tax=Tissierella sp. MB52-C2 TaxID=3070999 RepID=UPI00280B16A3|nr:MATE family efflux transporter [Tissierella sp. MB52-C2]WMM23718.1 MATE family efflux transporter [Tissierella sp. MB52-C2]
MAKEYSNEDRIIRNKILSMIIPITGENILQMTAGIVLMAMIGRIDAYSVGAIGIATVLYRILWGIFKGIATGTSVLVAQSHGANNYEKLKSVSEQSFIISIGVAIIFQQLLFWFAEPLLTVFNPNPELLGNGALYLKTISWSLPFAAIILLVAGILQGMGNARTPMIAVAILNVVNIIAGFILVTGKAGVKSLGLKGAGYAYNTAYIVSALFGIIMLFGKNGIIRNIGGKFEFKIKLDEAKIILKLGLPTSFETSFWQAASIFLTRAILTYGELAYSAYQLGLQAESISYMPATGFGVAATTFVGYALGSKDKELGKKYVNQLIRYTILVTIFAGGVLIIFPKQIMGLLVKEREVIQMGAMYLFVMGITQLPQNISGVLNGALRGAGYAKVPMINAGIGLWLIRVPFVMLMAYVFKADILWIWIGIGIDMCWRLVYSYFYFKKKDIFEQDALVIE